MNFSVLPYFCPVLMCNHVSYFALFLPNMVRWRNDNDSYSRILFKHTLKALCIIVRLCQIPSVQPKLRPAIFNYKRD